MSGSGRPTGTSAETHRLARGEQRARAAVVNVASGADGSRISMISCGKERILRSEKTAAYSASNRSDGFPAKPR